MPEDDGRPALLQGSLDMLILRTLVGEARHGYAIARHLHDVSEAFLQVEEGSLYPALHRLKQRGWVQAEWGVSESNRRARFYRITAKGRKQLREECDAWARMTRAISLVLNHRVAET